MSPEIVHCSFDREKERKRVEGENENGGHWSGNESFYDIFTTTTTLRERICVC